MTKTLNPEEWKAAMSLKIIGKTEREIAEILGCSRSQVNHGLNEGKGVVPQLKRWSDLIREDHKAVLVISKTYPVRERIVEALKIMRSNGKKSFTTMDLKKVMPDVQIQAFSNYLSGRHGKPTIAEEVPFKRSTKVMGENTVIYTFTNGQTVLPRGQVFDGRSDHDILLDLKARVEKLEASA